MREDLHLLADVGFLIDFPLCQLLIKHIFEVFKTIINNAIKTSSGWFPSCWAEGENFLAASSSFVLGGCVPLTLPTTLRYLAGPTGPLRFVGDDGFDGGWRRWHYRDKDLTAGQPSKPDGRSLWLGWNHQEYRCSWNCRWHVGGGGGGSSRLRLDGLVRRPWLWLFKVQPANV